MTNRERRRVVAALAGLAAAPLLPVTSARAAESIAPVIEKLTGGMIVRPGRVQLVTPRLADNGHSVALRISVDSPMTAADHVRSITVISDRNPRPVVATFHLGPLNGKAVVTTRVRLNGTQQLTAIAQLSDGSYWSGTADVVVTESACLDDS
jgi:sulfur-oxidizing protein SoxY